MPKDASFGVIETAMDEVMSNLFSSEAFAPDHPDDHLRFAVYSDTYASGNTSVGPA